MGFIPFIDIGLKLIDKIFPDPIDKANARAKLLEAEHAGELQELESSMAIITAEANGDSWLQRCWRPLVMITFTSLIVAKWLGFTAPGVSEAIEIELLNIIKVGLGGYILGRSGEKIMKSYKGK